MALTNDQKTFLVKMVKRDILIGSTMKESCFRNMSYGFKPNTIRRYYKIFKANSAQ